MKDLYVLLFRWSNLTSDATHSLNIRLSVSQNKMRPERRILHKFLKVNIYT